MYALFSAVNHLLDAKIAGNFVECGVWQGGSCMNMALTLLSRNRTNRDLWLYDTFEGMTPPQSQDVDLLGRSAADLLSSPDLGPETRCEATLETVKVNLESTGYPSSRIHYIAGAIKRTIPNQMPEKISLLRLDTDWYESTRHELEHLYPRVSSGGIVLIDDYGHWQGCRKAVDEFLVKTKPRPFLTRIDYTGRLFVKP